MVSFADSPTSSRLEHATRHRSQPSASVSDVVIMIPVWRLSVQEDEASPTHLRRGSPCLITLATQKRRSELLPNSACPSSNIRHNYSPLCAKGQHRSNLRSVSSP